MNSKILTLLALVWLIVGATILVASLQEIDNKIKETTKEARNN